MSSATCESNEEILITNLELRRIELRAFRMQSEHSTTELQPRTSFSTSSLVKEVSRVLRNKLTGTLLWVFTICQPSWYSLGLSSSIYRCKQLRGCNKNY
ncbi:hypothetical protein OUZ56_025039 [Daphnia magna]|uniref:Uncharacterized protein n=1 Tax=Daphnia magna TaxID=35525 RepID=A0ABQ9ZIN0_9CRUS|nr:hypothetical protein OUZ56_025039 [Daphnia magna]